MIGNPQSLPFPLIINLYGTCLYEIKKNKREFKRQQQVLLTVI